LDKEIVLIILGLLLSIAGIVWYFRKIFYSIPKEYEEQTKKKGNLERKNYYRDSRYTGVDNLVFNRTFSSSVVSIV
jgi:hypothetical protein